MTTRANNRLMPPTALRRVSTCRARHRARLPRRPLAGVRLTMLTAYDCTMARLLDAAGVDGILVGDSLGMVVQGQSDCLAVTLDEMVYHTRW